MDYESFPPCPELLPKLREEQEKRGNISETALKRISKETGIPISRIFAAASFYAHLHFNKQGKYVIEICNSPSCYLNGGLDVIKLIEKELKIKSGQTTKDGLFSLHICSCIGCCDKAPAMKINQKVYDSLTKEKVKKIFDDLKKKCKSSKKQASKPMKKRKK
jgi:NADH-quinone oxidoreductase subunit E